MVPGELTDSAFFDKILCNFWLLYCYSDPFDKLHLLFSERFVLGIVLDPKAREVNRTDRNHVAHVEV